MSARKPPSARTILLQRAAKQLLGVGNRKPRAGRVQRDNFASSVRERKQVAIAGLPWILAGILDRRRIPVSEVRQRRQQVGLVAQHHLSLVLNGLDGQEGIAGVL